MILVIFMYLKLFQDKKLKDSLLNISPSVTTFSREGIKSIVEDKLERMGETIINPQAYLGYLLYARHCARHCEGFKEVKNIVSAPRGLTA